MKEGVIMKKVILNLLNALALICEIVLGLTALLLLISGIDVLINGKSMAKGMNIISNINNNLAVLFWVTILVAAMFIALAWTINSIRLVVKNIKHEVYFDQDNLKHLHATLISLGIFTILTIIESILTGIATAHKMVTTFNINFDFSGAVFSLIVLGIIYVIYLVFKNGLQLQEDHNKII